MSSCRGQLVQYLLTTVTSCVQLVFFVAVFVVRGGEGVEMCTCLKLFWNLDIDLGGADAPQDIVILIPFSPTLKSLASDEDYFYMSEAFVEDTLNRTDEGVVAACGVPR